MADVKVKIEGDASSLISSVRSAEAALGRLSSNAANAQRSLDGINRSAQSVTGALGSLVAAVAGQSLFNFVDGLQNMSNKLLIASKSQEEFNTSLAVVKQIADSTGQSLTATGDLYSKVAQNAGKLGYNQAQVATVTNAFATALKASGASAQGAASSIYQFSQILNKGKVNGDEFTTIMENMGGPVMDLVAKNMGLTTAELVKLKEKGLIGAKDFTDALIRSMDALGAMSGKTAPTVGQSLQRIQNSFGTLILNFEAATGALAGTAVAMNFLAKNIDVVVIAGMTFFTLFAATRILAAATAFLSLARSVGIMGAALNLVGKSPVMLILSGLVAAAAYFSGTKLFGDAPDQAADLAKMMEEAKNQTGETSTQLTGVVDKYQEITKELRQQLAISGVSPELLSIENQLLTYKKQLEGQITAEQEKELRGLLTKIDLNKNIAKITEDLRMTYSEIATLAIEDVAQRRIATELEKQRKSYGDAAFNAKRAEIEAAVRAQVIAEAQRSIQVELLKIQDEQYGLAIRDSNQREIALAIRQKERELGSALTQEQRNQLELEIKKTQAARDANMIYEARRKLLGEMTKEEAVNRGVGVQQRMNPQNTLGTEYKMDQDALKAHLDSKLITEQVYQDQLLLLKQEYANKANELYIQQVENEKQQRQTQVQADQMRLGKTAEQAKQYAEFEMKTAAEKTQFGIDQGAQMFTALGQYNKEAFLAAKAFNIANAIMNTYMAATKALASLPPPFSFIAAAAAVGMGLAQVAQIRSQQYTGKAKGGPVGGGMPYLVGEKGPEIFTPSSSGNITPNNQLGTGGGVSVNFTINAVDTQGFDDLLVERRGVITQIIRDAMVENGQRGI